MFLQIIEMEQKSCTIRLMDKTSGRLGVLFFGDGELFDARVDGKQGEAAAYEIFSWDEVSLSIQNHCPLKEKRIQRELQAILLEAMRLRDETGHAEELKIIPVEFYDLDEVDEWEEAPPQPFAPIKAKLERELGDRWALEEIYWDDSWDGILVQMMRIGRYFNAGQLKLSYIDRGEDRDFILLPGDRTTVITLNPRCPRDRIIRALS